MPTKKNSKAADGEDDKISKPKAAARRIAAKPKTPAKKPARKIKEELKLDIDDDTPLTDNLETAPIVSAAIAHAASSHQRMGDIKPKSAAPSAASDTSFLAPEGFSFNLRHKNQPRHDIRISHGWLKPLSYFLATIIVLMAISLVLLTYYSQKAIDQGVTSGSLTGVSLAGSGSTQHTGAYTFTITNAQADEFQALSDAVNGHFQGEVTFSSMPTTLSTDDHDVLYYKSGAQPELAKMQDFLSAYNIKPQLTPLDTIKSDMVLYLTTSAKVIDLSKYTATSNNASTTTGLAKKYCTILQSYKISKCTAQNSTATAVGLTVYYKSDVVMVALGRIKEFQSATLQKGDASQTEDIKVVAGNAQ